MSPDFLLDLECMSQNNAFPHVVTVAILSHFDQVFTGCYMLHLVTTGQSDQSCSHDCYTPVHLPKWVQSATQKGNKHPFGLCNMLRTGPLPVTQTKSVQFSDLCYRLLNT